MKLAFTLFLVVLMILPAVYLVYSSYKLYMDRLTLYSRQMEKDLLHIHELNDRFAGR